MNEPLKLEVLELIAKSGACYTNEAKAMAAEIIELRKARDEAAGAAIYRSIYGNGP